MYIQVFIPPELEKNALQIKRFFDAMLYKLRKNVHKPSFERTDVAHCLSRIKVETEELEQAIAEGNTTEILLESADIGNFALLASVAAIERDGRGTGELDRHHDAPTSPAGGTTEAREPSARPDTAPGAADATERPATGPHGPHPELYGDRGAAHGG